jgi:hypothetical protein
MLQPYEKNGQDTHRQIAGSETIPSTHPPSSYKATPPITRHAIRTDREKVLIESFHHQRKREKGMQGGRKKIKMFIAQTQSKRKRKTQSNHPLPDRNAFVVRKKKLTPISFSFILSLQPQLLPHPLTPV